ncbi:hypothetical protein ACFL6U_32255 [Planctomycetota bacterium]
MNEKGHAKKGVYPHSRIRVRRYIKLHAESVFNPTGHFQYPIFQEPEVLVAGGVDPDTQDWTVELKIPWVVLVGDFPQDMANGDLDGNGRDVFPPVVGDIIGFAIIVIDRDGAARRMTSATSTGFWPWYGDAAGRSTHPTFSGIRPPDYNGQWIHYDNEMMHFAMDRHSKGVNAVFLDDRLDYSLDELKQAFGASTARNRRA